MHRFKKVYKMTSFDTTTQTSENPLGWEETMERTPWRKFERSTTDRICNNSAWYTGELFKPVLFTPDGRVVAPEGIGTSYDDPPTTGRWTYNPTQEKVGRNGRYWITPGSVEVQINGETFNLYIDVGSAECTDYLLEVGSFVKQYLPSPNNTFSESMEVRCDGIHKAYSFSQRKDEDETWCQTIRRLEAFRDWQKREDDENSE